MAFIFSGSSTPYIITNQAQTASLNIVADGSSNAFTVNLNNLPFVMNIPSTNGPAGIHIAPTTQFTGTYPNGNQIYTWTYNTSAVYDPTTFDLTITFTPGIGAPSTILAGASASLNFTFYYTSL